MDMKNFKINKNQQPLSEADIAKGKDFGKLINAYKAAKLPLYKTPKFWIGASSILVASISALLILNKINAPDNKGHPFIAPPLASADIQSSVYILNAQSGSTITYPGGSKIRVPANAFLDKNGNAVKGDIDLHYREFKKIDEVFMAGIPMTYDSLGEQYHFETAGMIEIAASQNGEPLKTNPAALVKVDIVSANKDDRFNTYYLDTVTKKWKYVTQKNYNPALHSDLGAVQKAAPQAESQSIKQVQKEIAALEKQKPGKPRKQDKGRPRFSIKVDPVEFPEIAVYKGVKFQVEDSSYKPEKADVTWSDIELKRLPGNNRYQITFINPGEKYQVIAVPVFGDKDYDQAMAVYNKKYNEFGAALAKKKAEAAAAEAQMQARYAAMDKRQQDLEDRRAKSDLFYRSFEVSDFGYWNSDHPCRLPAGNNMVKLNLIDARTKAPVHAEVCYLVEKERNALFAYGATGLERFRFDPEKHNGVWIITTDNKLAVAKYSDFKAAQIKGRQMNLPVTVVKKAVKTTDEVRQCLEL